MIIFYMVFCCIPQRSLPQSCLPLQLEQAQISPTACCWPLLMLHTLHDSFSTKYSIHSLLLDSWMGPPPYLTQLSLQHKLNTQITLAPCLEWNWLEIQILISSPSSWPQACLLICNWSRPQDKSQGLSNPD